MSPAGASVPPPDTPPRTWRDPLRYLWQTGIFWLLTALVVPAILASLLLTLGRAKDTLAVALVRAWGRTMLRVCGVRLRIEPAAAAELARRRRRVLTFNHASTLDMFLMTALWPDNATAVVKREMLWIPLVGWGVFLMGFLPLDRGRRAKATASLQRAAQQVRRKDLTLIIAPEGTRSPTGQVLPFKLGAFHLAAEADAPIVGLILHGTRQTWPRWRHHARPGTVTVRVLPEQPSGADDPSSEAIHRRAAHLHDLYVAELAAMDRSLAL